MGFSVMVKSVFLEVRKGRYFQGTFLDPILDLYLVSVPKKNYTWICLVKERRAASER